MSDNNYQIYFDCGFSKLRAGAFNKLNSIKAFYTESKLRNTYGFNYKQNITKEINSYLSSL